MRTGWDNNGRDGTGTRGVLRGPRGPKKQSWKPGDQNDEAWECPCNPAVIRSLFTSRHLHPSTCCHFSHNHHSSSTLGSCTNLEVHCVMTLPPKTLLKFFTFNINVTSLQAYQTNIVLICADLAENQHIKIATKFWRYEADLCKRIRNSDIC